MMTGAGNGDLSELDRWRKEGRAWLEANAPARGGSERPDHADSVAVFHNLAPEEARRLLATAAAWQQRKLAAGFAAITWPREAGGAGLPREYERAFEEEEADFATPDATELFDVTVRLIAPTIATHGTPEQQARYVAPLLRTEFFACQLFSEPGAGSDLANLSCRAVRDGDEWLVDGQKVWSSGAQFAAYGLLIARTDVGLPKHRGMTAFLVPLDRPGVEIRPIRQMTGGTAFNEVFFTGVRIEDSLRLGAVGQGWEVALTTLSFEREGSGTADRGIGGSFTQLLAIARQFGRTADPLIRQQLADVYIRDRLRRWNTGRALAATHAGQQPGPEGSIGKLLWTQQLARISDVASSVIGPALIADSGVGGAYAWTEHVLGAPGYRIAGGSDEIQRNIIGERVLGLPPEPRVDKGIPYKDVVR
jgi:alkylation response protein AidB-like acyl-CoA dehydrogenase